MGGVSIMLSLVLCVAFSPTQAQILTADSIISMGNNSLFERWRPYSHFIAPAGWMNDPCGLLYDPVTELYHMHYQFHPLHVNWGNISWGHATSKDLITWKDVNSAPDNGYAAWQWTNPNSIVTTNLTSAHHDPAPYNHLGIWTGSAQPVNLTGGQDGTLLALYTSVSRLPLSWNTPYPTGAESQSFAYSTDGGVTWEQWAGNPVMNEPPGDWNITGWRDPYFHTSTALDHMLGYPDPHYYVVFGSGIHGLGPRMPLYSAPASNLTDWTFLGALWEPSGNETLGNLAETGPYGYQWECSNFFEIDGHWFVGMGIQGGATTAHNHNWVLWNEGTVSVRPNGSIAFSPISGGASDWGNLYAITSFEDTKINRRVQYGWSNEDSNNFGITQQGWQGTFSLPRELFVKKTVGVAHRASHTTPGNSYYTADKNGVWTARTLGLRPLPDVVKALRAPASHTSRDLGGLVIHADDDTAVLARKLGHSYEVRVAIQSTTGVAGVTIAASPDGQEYTNVYYDPTSKSIGVDRTHSSLITEFSTQLYEGYFKAYEFAGGQTEAIVMDVWVDGSMVEVYVNDRFALTSRIYPSKEESSGVMLLVEEGASVEFGKVDIWEGLLNIWPERPKNSSSLLIFDTPAETGNYTWWGGN